jgi:type 1 glutamine amidotransferase
MPAGIAAAEKKPIRVQLVTGGHSYDFSFYSIFDGQDDLAITVDPHPSAFRRDMRNEVDVLVLYDLADVTEDPRQKNLRDFVDAGKGVVALHHAIADNQDWKWWSEEVIGGLYLLKPSGDRPGSTYKHDIDMNVQPVLKHPITAGIDAFRINDEAYKQMWISPKNRILLRTDHPLSDGPVAWIGPAEKSRVVYIQLGHGPLAHRHPAYRKLVRQAILWTAGRT